MKCQECPRGRYSTGTKNIRCSKCGAGLAAPDAKSSCRVCGAGTYQGRSVSEQYLCSTCESGRFTSDDDRAEVSMIEEGRELIHQFFCPEGSEVDDAMCDSDFRKTAVLKFICGRRTKMPRW